MALEALEAQLVRDKNHALVLYTSYAEWGTRPHSQPVGTW